MIARIRSLKARIAYRLQLLIRKPVEYFVRGAAGASRVSLKFAVFLGPKLGAMRLRRGKVRTLWGVTPILTLPLKAKADRELGFQSASLVYVTYVTTSRFDINLSRPLALAHRYGLGLAFQRLVLAWALLRYDVFNFFADSGLLGSSARLQIDGNELSILKKAGKRLYVYAYGADVRTRQATIALGKWNFCVDCTEAPKYCTCRDAQAEEYILELQRHATSLVSLGDMLTYMPSARHINYWPLDVNAVKARFPIEASGPLRIAHAPNHTHFKGSKYLELAIERLKAQGHQIEYSMVQGVPNDRVMAVFADADVIADQFIGGAYGYTALEAMALGKPVLSYVRSAELVDAPEECPIINTTPDNLEKVLLWIIDNRERLRQIGEQGRRYVERWCTISAVAARLGKLYQDTADFPQEIVDQIQRAREREDVRRNSIPISTGWQHPFQVTGGVTV